MPYRRTIIVSGMVAAVPAQGGATWAVLQYLLGLQELGHRVYFVETFGLRDRAALLLHGTRESVGLPYDSLRAIASHADALINLAGMLTDPDLTGSIPIRVYLDLDPGFTQLWHTQGIDMRFAGHSHFATIGQNIGAPDCPVPACGLPWIATRPPVVLAHWPVATRIADDAFTTVGHWRGYGSIVHDGVLYGQKAHSLRQFIAAPTQTSEQFRLALAIHPGEERDLRALARNGWQIRDPATCANTPGRYRAFIQGSKAEFGIAKSGYVAARCGWFSDRSACYLASGRPVIAQEAGFSDFLPTGAGLLAFATQDDLLAGIDTICRDYAHHARAARAIAREYFDARTVLAHLLTRVGIDP
jgi:hypothetical protein